jgi:hypothetical protein
LNNPRIRVLKTLNKKSNLAFEIIFLVQV